MARVWGVGALGDEALEDFGVPVFVECLESIPCSIGADVGIVAIFVGVGKVQESVFGWGFMLDGPWGECSGHGRIEGILAFIVGGLVGGNVVEQHETAAPEGVAALQGFAVEPLHFGWQVGGANRFQHGGKLPLDREAFAAPVPHAACRRMHEGAPAVDFGFVSPLAALGAGEVERPAIGGTERVGWDHGEFRLSSGWGSCCVARINPRHREGDHQRVAKARLRRSSTQS